MKNLNAAASVQTYPYLPILLLLFAGSGCAALIYEIVWLQLLQLVIGSSAVSLGVLLGTFMGGMCLGSFALPRLLSTQRHPLRVYALLELSIGVLGVAVLQIMPLVNYVYAAMVGHGLAGILLRGVVAGVCLLPPTVLMGATLPAIARWVEATPQGVSWLGFFYGANITGAVVGCLLAGFYLLRLFDMATAIYVAAAINAGVACISLALAAATPHQAATREAAQERLPGHAAPWSIYLTIALSGAVALAAEVIWTRLLSLMLGATVYTFSIILAVFLVGLGLGSGLGSLLARRTKSPRLALGACQLLVPAAIAWTAFMISRYLPYSPVNPYLGNDILDRPRYSDLSQGLGFDFQLDLVRCLWAILPATCLWGASFPLALAAAASRGQDPGRLVGGVYAANTLGAIVGALASSLLLIRWVGTQDAQRVLIGVSAVAAVLVLAPYLWYSGATVSSDEKSRKIAVRIGGAVLLGGGAGLSVLLAWSVRGVPWEGVAFGHTLPSSSVPLKLLFLGEGMNSSVAVTEELDGSRIFHVSGKAEASTHKVDMQLQRMLGHLPALLHPRPRSVLIVGCGAGVTAGTFMVYPEIERILICEIEPLVPQVVAEFFARENYNVVQRDEHGRLDPRVEIVYDDARHFILTTPEKFDIITSDPIHPWVKGSATLYTKEYFELCKQHLNPGGVITQWVPLYESTVNVVKSEMATFFEAFPHGTVWSNVKQGQGYDLVLVGQDGASKINLDEIQQRLDSRDYKRVAASLDELKSEDEHKCDSSVWLFSTYGGQASDLKPWLEHAEINRDRNLRLQYLAGMALNIEAGNRIYNQIKLYRRFPEEILGSSGARAEMVRARLKP